jgi:hypothetical protein
MSFDLSGRIAVAIKRICLLRRWKEGGYPSKNAPPRLEAFQLTL